MVEIAIVEAAIVVIVLWLGFTDAILGTLGPPKFKFFPGENPHSELESYLEKIEVWQAAEDCIKAISRDGPTSQTFEQATEEMERTEE